MDLNKLLALGLVILMAGCTTQETEVTPTGEVKEFEITARQFEFEPATIRANLGDTVKLKIRSVDVPHGIAIPEFGVSERLEPGEEVQVEFVANKQGTFTFFCNVPCGSGHRDMKGQLIVE
jgi:cytochrome c oxidase subunit 2